MAGCAFIYNDYAGQESAMSPPALVLVLVLVQCDDGSGGAAVGGVSWLGFAKRLSFG